MSQDQGKMGRPRKELNWKLFEQLCQMQCTAAEIAGFFHMTRDTLNARIKELTGETFSTLYDELSQGGKVSLRRAQWTSAIGNKSVKPSVTMQMWLGKQHLGQSDKIEAKTEESKVFEFKSNPERST